MRYKLVIVIMRWCQLAGDLRTMTYGARFAVMSEGRSLELANEAQNEGYVSRGETVCR